jgi:hypothetical protein
VLKVLKCLSYLSLCLFFFSGPANAKEMKAVMKLVSIEALKTSEKSGDEIYLDITQYSNLSEPRHFRIPEKPMHWLSKQLPDLKNLVLWQGTLKEAEEVKIIITLIEQDVGLWDREELIGTAQVQVANKGGNFVKKWDIPVFKDPVPEEMAKAGEPRAFELKGENSDYRLVFSLEQQ